MKNAILPFILALIFTSCESEGELTRTEVGAIPISEESTVVYNGKFVATSGINVTGFASILQDKDSFKIALKDFSVSSGPDLKVYLSTSASPDTFINLGAVGNGSSQTFLIPDGVDLKLYNHVLIYCQQYSHLFASATLQLN